MKMPDYCYVISISISDKLSCEKNHEDFWMWCWQSIGCGVGMSKFNYWQRRFFCTEGNDADSGFVQAPH